MRQFSRSPVTYSLLGLIVLSFLLSMLRVPGLEALILTESGRPWAFLTYPFAPIYSGSALFLLIITALWLYSFGTQVEARNGWRGALWASAGFALVAGLCVFTGAKALGTPLFLAGPFAWGTGVAFVWGLQNRNAVVNLFCLIPVKGNVIAILSLVLFFFAVMDFHPALGLFTLPAFGLFHWWAASATGSQGGKDRSARRKEKQQRNILDLAHDKQKERQEKERLRKLFEASMIEDPDAKKD